jgi:hypothetical protein
MALISRLFGGASRSKFGGSTTNGYPRLCVLQERAKKRHFVLQACLNRELARAAVHAQYGHLASRRSNKVDSSS